MVLRLIPFKTERPTTGWLQRSYKAQYPLGAHQLSVWNSTYGAGMVQHEVSLGECCGTQCSGTGLSCVLSSAHR
jgi:hypothetical protein